MADCERGLGNLLRALALAGSPEVKRLEKSEEIEMRMVAAGAQIFTRESGSPPMSDLGSRSSNARIRRC